MVCVFVVVMTCQQLTQELRNDKISDLKTKFCLIHSGIIHIQKEYSRCRVVIVVKEQRLFDCC